MTWNRPAIIKDQDILRVLYADEAEYRVPFTFIEALNEGVLFDRSARAFRTAARAHHLFELVNTRTEAIIGTCVIQETPDTQGQQYEVGGMMIHPGARHLGLNTLLTKAVMVRQLCADRHALPGIEYLAHVVDGNAGPTHSLLASGFRSVERVIVKPGEVDADVQHMIEPDGEGVVMQSYVFDQDRGSELVMDLHRFLRDEGSVVRVEDLSFRVDLSALISVEDLDRYLSGQDNP